MQLQPVLALASVGIARLHGPFPRMAAPSLKPVSHRQDLRTQARIWPLVADGDAAGTDLKIDAALLGGTSALVLRGHTGGASGRPHARTHTHTHPYARALGMHKRAYTRT